MLADTAVEAGGSDELAARIRAANTVAEAFQMASAEDIRLGDHIAGKAWHTAAAVLRHAEIALEIVVFDRDGALVGKTDFRPSHEASRPLKRR